jgi:hypothetical protein
MRVAVAQRGQPPPQVQAPSFGIENAADAAWGCGASGARAGATAVLFVRAANA